MANTFKKALNIESGEGTKVILLVLQSFFFGVFISSFEISSSSLFMKRFGEAMVPLAYIASGGVGIVLALLFSVLQSKVKYTQLALYNLIFVTVFILLLRFGFVITDDKWLTFVVFIMMGPLFVVAFALGFWGIVSRMFSIRQGKRLFGMIDSGLIIGAIVSGFTIPFIVELLPGIEDLLVICAVCVIITLFIQVYITGRYKKDFELAESEGQKAIEESIIKEEKKKSIYSDKYVMLISMFMMLTTVSAFLIYFNFLSVAKANYPSEVEFAKFYSFFGAIIMVFTLFFKTVLYGKLMKMFGLRANLLILPITLIIVTFLAIFSGVWFGYDIGSQGFLFFFLLISLSRLLSKSIHDAVEIPSFKLLYQPLPLSIRYKVQTNIDGFVNELAGAVTGIFLIVLGLFDFIDLIHYNILLGVILVVCVWLIVKLYAEYKNTLQKTLTASSNNPEDVKDMSISAIKRFIDKEQTDQKMLGIYLSEKMYPDVFMDHLLDMLNDPSKEVRDFALKYIEKNIIIEGIDALNAKPIVAEEYPDKVKATIDLLESKKSILGKDIELDLMARSREIEKRVIAARVIAYAPSDEHTVVLLTELLRDIEPSVRLAAIQSAGKLNIPSLYPFLTNNLASPLYRKAATSALLHIGDPCVSSLEQSFHKSGIDNDTMISIIRLLSDIGTKDAVKHLVNKIDFSESLIARETLIGLNRCIYTAKKTDLAKFYKLVEFYAENILRNLVVIDLAQNNDLTKLEKALIEENNDHFDMLYLVLAILYDVSAIEKIRENIEAGTPQSIGYAIELLDLLVAEEIKPVVFPLFEDVSIEEKERLLQNYFVIRKSDLKESLLDIINRDYNRVHKWTKACALAAYNDLKFAVTGDIIAVMFHEDELISELAAKIVFERNPKEYAEIVKRLNVERQFHLENCINSKIQNTTLLFDKVLAIENFGLLKYMHKTLLIALARHVTRIIPENTRPTIIEEGFYFIERGGVYLTASWKQLKAGAVYTNLAFEGSEPVTFPPNTVLYKVNELDYYKLSAVYDELSEALVTMITQSEHQEYEENKLSTN